MDSPVWARTCLCAVALTAPNLTLAEATDEAAASIEAPARVVHAVGANALMRSLDSKDLGFGAQAEYRLRWPSEYQLGLSASLLALEADRIAGYAAKDTRRVEVTALTGIPLGRTGPLALDLRAGLSYIHLSSDDQSLEDQAASRAGIELGVIGSVTVTPRTSVRLGFSTPFAFELSPSGELATGGTLVSTGAGFAVTDSLLLRGDVETGGMFGFDGDGTKYETRVSVGLRWVSGQNARLFNVF